MAATKTLRFKVSLCDFADVRAPIGYDVDFVQRLLFDATRPDKSPPRYEAEFGAIAYQFFLSSSEGYLRIEGDVVDWVQSAVTIENVPRAGQSGGKHLSRSESLGPISFTAAEGVLNVGRAREHARVIRAEGRRSATTFMSYPWVVDCSAMVNHYYLHCVDRDSGHPSFQGQDWWVAPPASRFGYGPTRLSAQRVKEDLHHLPGHQPFPSLKLRTAVLHLRVGGPHA